MTQEVHPKQDLGELVATYQGKGIDLLSAPTLLVLGLFSLLILLPTAYGLQRGYYGYTEFGLMAAVGWSIPWILIGLVMALPLGLCLFIRSRNSHRSISIHEGGLHARLGHRKEYFVRWDEIAGVKYEGVQTYFLVVPLPTAHRLAIVLADGRTLPLDDRIRQIDRLGDEIKNRIYPTILSGYRRDFGSGKPVSFGPMAIDRRGVKLNHNQIGWDEIEEIIIQRGHLIVKSGRENAVRIPVFEIPNLELLLTLINGRTS